MDVPVLANRQELFASVLSRHRMWSGRPTRSNGRYEQIQRGSQVKLLLERLDDDFL